MSLGGHFLGADLMREILTAVEIRATPERVWKVLTDFGAYPKWNPLFWPEPGEVVTGARIRVRLRLAGGLRSSFIAKVTECQPGHGFAWLGRLAGGLLEGRHSFVIERLAPGRVRFVQREVFSGPLTPIHMLLMGGWLRRAYARVNEALRARAESSPA